jgi:hypothetical protein
MAPGPPLAYRKMWLGGAESDRFTPGTEPAALEVDGWWLGLAICKDTGIPQHAADGGGFAQAAGRSAIWGSDGVVVDRAGPEPGAISSATLS